MHYGREGPSETAARPAADGDASMYRVPVDWESESVGETIVMAVSAVSGKPLTALPKLANIIDPDALDRLFRPSDHRPRADTGRVQFVYAGYQVTVSAQGWVAVSVASDRP